MKSLLKYTLLFSLLCFFVVDAASVNAVELEQRMEALRVKADSGDAVSALQLADIYAQGDAGVQDLDSAVRYYGKAADLNNEEALIKMKAMPPVFTSAWWQARADRGDASAMRGLAESYVSAKKPDMDSAARCYGEAADAGDALSLEKMKTLPYEYTCTWWERKAFAGDSAAASLAAQSYEEGRGIHADRYQAVRFYAMAADAGDSAAVRTLQVLPLSDTVAWWDQRAMKGDVKATLHLAQSYGTAQLGAIKVIAAMKYCILAAVQGEMTYLIGLLSAVGLFVLLLAIRPTRGFACAIALILAAWFSVLMVLP